MSAEPIASDVGTTRRARHLSTHYLVRSLLSLLAFNYNRRPSLRRWLRHADGWFDFAIGFCTESGSVEVGIVFDQGKVRALGCLPAQPDTVMILRDDAVVREMLRVTPNETMNMLLRNKMRMRGNLACLNLFNFFVSILLEEHHRRLGQQQRAQRETERRREAPALDEKRCAVLARRRAEHLTASRVDPGVRYLDDPYLARYSLDDFPRLRRYREAHLRDRPEICCERLQLLTQWYREHGFETDRDGKPWVPELRQAMALKHLMEHRRPIVREHSLLAGSHTTKEIGVLLYGDGQACMFWGELLSIPYRELRPYEISDQTRRILHHELLPFWIKRNFHDWVRERYDEPLCQQLENRWAVYFLWKRLSISHTILDFPKLLRLGARGIIDEIAVRLAAADESGADQRQRDTWRAMILCLEGLIAYARNCSAEAKRLAESEPDAKRRAELERMAAACQRVPEFPATTLDEAMHTVWLGWVALHMENTNTGLSFGRLDQFFQPYFEADLHKLQTAAERETYVEHAIELAGCLYGQHMDQVPLSPDIGNYLFCGTSSSEAVTLGGVKPDGTCAVNDMTYIFLKVTELFGTREPNVNARFHPGINSDTYLRRLCEVNLATTATPSMHNDVAVMDSLAAFGYPPEHLRDWSATGCVEATISGRHMGMTNCMMFNAVAALEMALNNGRHPLMRWDVGPRTGAIEQGAFATFEDFYAAFEQQLRFLVEQSVEYNNILGHAHTLLRPTPLLSSLIDGCIEHGRDATHGGARYNTSGVAVIGLADITDSLLVIEQLVYDQGQVSLAELKQAVDANFEGHARLHALARNKVRLFGSGDDAAVAMANRVAATIHDLFGARLNHRGGPYTTGFWSMSNHAAFGALTGALPSGRLAGKAFTPGLTPEPHASKNLLDNIRDVARLDHRNCDNNLAFNIKVVPRPGSDRAATVDELVAYVKSYFELGGMQIQLNAVDTATLRDAMAHPEAYRDLLVRISGYNAYFVTLYQDMQRELIERAEYNI
ncbi:MAG: formate acetyltransferase [Deltaproteobacteria bacterium]|nr:formate acetyltransferase [Deltaproteobacteria bacterium]